MDRRAFIGAIASNLVVAPVTGSSSRSATPQSERVESRRSAATLARGFARNIGTYASGLPGGANITDYSGITYDAVGHRMCLFGGGHGPSQETDIRTLDMGTLAWSSLYPSTPRSEMTLTNGDSEHGRWRSTNQPYARHTYNMTGVVDRRFYMFTWYGQPDNLPSSHPPYGGRVCWYDFDREAWSYSRHSASATPWEYYAAAVLDPVSQKFLIAGYGREVSPGYVWIYDPEDDEFIVGPAFPAEIGYAHEIVYFPIDGLFYVFQADGRVWRIALDRQQIMRTTVTSVTVRGTRPPKSGRCGFAFDDSSRRIGGNISNGIYYAFDPMTSEWTSNEIQVESGSSGVPDQVFHCLEFDTTSGCFVCLAGANAATSWLYRPPSIG